MSRFTTIRRRLLLGAGFVVVLSGLSLCVAHTALVRRFALVQIQTRLGNTEGLILKARDLDYNLLTGRFELKEVVVRGSQLADMPPALQAQRVALVIPTWRLLRGSFESAQIRIDGLAVRWITGRDGRANLPPIPTGTGGKSGGPSIIVNGAAFYVQDDRNGLALALTNAHLSAIWNSQKREYAIACRTSGGEARWNQMRLALDQLQLKSTLAGGNFSLESLSLVSGSSQALLTGALSGSPGRVQASANFDLDLDQLSRALSPTAPARGRVQVHVSAGGPLEAMLLDASLRGEDLVIGGIPIRRPLADAVFDIASGELRIRSLAAGLFSGQLTAQGKLSTAATAGRSELTASLSGVALRQLAASFGSPGFPAVRAEARVTASWPGLDWRVAQVSGVARARTTRVAFNASANPASVRAVLDTTIGEGSAFPSAIHSDLTIRLAGQTITGTVHGDTPSIGQLTGQLEELLDRPRGSLSGSGIDGAASWSSTVQGTLRHPSLALDLGAKDLSIGEWNGADLQVQAQYDGDRIAIQHVQLVWAGQQVEAKGEIGGTSADAPVQVTATVHGQSLTPTFEKLGMAPLAGGALSGEVRIAGSLGSPTAQASLRTGDLTAYGQGFSSSTVDARWQSGVLTVDRIAAEQAHGAEAPGRLQASGSLAVDTGKYAVTATGENLRPADLPDGTALGGVFALTAEGEGTLDEPLFGAQLSGKGVKIGGEELGDLCADAYASQHHGILHIAAPAFHAQATSSISMTGSWPFELELQATDTHLKLGPETSFNATLRAKGSLAPLEIEKADASVRDLRIATPGTETTADGPIELSFADGSLQVASLAVKSGSSVLRASGALPLDSSRASGTLSLKGTVDLADLARWAPGMAAAHIGGTAEVNAGISGSLRNWTPSGTATIREGHIDAQPVPLRFENIGGQVRLQDGIVHLAELSGKAGNGSVRIDGSLPLRLISSAFPVPTADTNQPARFSAQAENLEISTEAGATAVTATLSLKAEGEASALSLSALRASVECSRLDAKSPDRDLQQTTPTRIAIANSTARLENLDLKGTGSTLKASGTVGLTGQFPLEMDAAGQLDLSFLSKAAPPLEASGTAQLDVHVGGTLRSPKTKGFVQVDNVNLGLPSPSVRAGLPHLRADLDGDLVTLQEFNGTLNAGALRGGGSFKVSDGTIRDANLFLQGKDTFMEFPAAVKTVSSVDLKLVSQKEQLLLQGQVEIQEGFYEASIDLFSRSAPAAGLPAQGSAVSVSTPINLDIGIVTKRPVEMDNNLGRISATAVLRVGGTASQPRLTGALQLEEDGKLYFGDRSYYIERGTIRFLNAATITPDLDIKAYTRTNDYTIRLGLTGTPKEITTTFTSDPPLTRDDVIAVLLTGKTVAENRGVDLRALEATSLATGALNATLSSQLNRSVGISRVSIQPEAVAAESNPGARITITQDFTRTFRLLYSMNLSDSNDQIWVGEYDLSRQFTTRAVKQSDNTYRGEFRHDIQFGATTPAAVNAAVHIAKRRISSVQFTGGGPFSAEELAQAFKPKPGQEYKAAKVRKGADKLSRLFTKNGYLESRVRIDRDDSGQAMGITVRIELGPIVELAFDGAELPGKQKSRLRDVWHAGISDQQRPLAAKAAILSYYARKGYLRAEVESHASVEGERKVVRFDLKPGTQYRDVKLAVEGAPQPRDHDILALLHDRRLELAVYRDPVRVVEAVTGFYQQRGYLAAQVGPPRQELDPARRTGRVVIPVKEGPVYRVGEIRFAGNQALDDEELSAGAPLEPGAVFEPARLEPTLAALKLKYGQLGYRDARIEYEIARQDDRSLVNVSFTVIENQQTSIGAIKVEGNRRTSVKFARSRLKVAEGEVANTEKLRESVKSLSQTGAYSTADIQVRPPAPAGADDRNIQVADLVVAVSEPKPFRLLYGGLYDTGNGPGFIADFQNRNLIGAGRVLGLRTRVDSETDEARLYVTRPFWRQKRLSTTLATYFTRDTEYHQTTPTEKLGVSIQQDLQLPSRMLLSYGYRFERQRGFVPDPAAPDIPESVVSVAPITLTISRDSRDSFLDATRGAFMSHGFELAPHILGSDYPYLRYYLQYFTYFALTRPSPVPFGEQPRRSRLIFATGSRVGLQKGFNSTGAVLTDRFYAGGGTTVRGFKQDELGPKLANGQPAGGNAVLVLNEEIRYPLFWVFDAVTFVDIGNVFPRVSDFRLSELRAATGFGLRLRNPFVVLRFDYGFKLGRRPGETMGAFFFSIGQAF